MAPKYQQYTDAAKFWAEIDARLDNCITYMRNPAHADSTVIELVINLLSAAQEICVYRKKIMTKKAKACEVLLDLEEN